MSPPEPVSYEAFRTGLTYRDVYWMLWSADPDPSTWRHKGRGSVLGKWRQMKREMYAYYVAACVGNDNLRDWSGE